MSPEASRVCLSLSLYHRSVARFGALRHTSAVPRIVTHVATIDSGPGGPSGTPAKIAWVTLSAEEAEDLLEALTVWRDGVNVGLLTDGWHAHVTDAHGNELTVEVSAFDQRSGGSDPA